MELKRKFFKKVKNDDFDFLDFRRGDRNVYGDFGSLDAGDVWLKARESLALLPGKFAGFLAAIFANRDDGLVVFKAYLGLAFRIAVFETKDALEIFKRSRNSSLENTPSRVWAKAEAADKTDYEGVSNVAENIG